MRAHWGLHEFRSRQGYSTVQKWWQKQSLSNREFALGNHEEKLGMVKTE